MSLTAQSAFEDVRSLVTSLNSFVCTYLLRGWLVPLELEFRRSDKIFWNNKVLSVFRDVVFNTFRNVLISLN